MYSKYKNFCFNKTILLKKKNRKETNFEVSLRKNFKVQQNFFFKRFLKLWKKIKRIPKNIFSILKSFFDSKKFIKNFKLNTKKKSFKSRLYKFLEFTPQKNFFSYFYF
jgi:hypothetical protein